MLINTFRKKERLCSPEAIRGCMSGGNSFGIAMLRLSYKIISEGTHDDIFFKEGVYARLMFSAPKKQNKRAVDRNFKKRHLREAYRKNKGGLCSFLSENNIKIHLVVIYRGTNHFTYQEVEEAMMIALKELRRRLEKKIKHNHVE